MSKHTIANALTTLALRENISNNKENSITHIFSSVKWSEHTKWLTKTDKWMTEWQYIKDQQHLEENILNNKQQTIK